LCGVRVFAMNSDTRRSMSVRYRLRVESYNDNGWEWSLTVLDSFDVICTLVVGSQVGCEKLQILQVWLMLYERRRGGEGRKEEKKEV
jgi:hypothetical protein